VRGSPSERRKFVDTAICQIKPSYAKNLNEYRKITDQRNSLLKDIKYNNCQYDMLDIWNEKLSEKAETIINERIKYINKTAENAEEIYNGLSGKSESIQIEYNMKISPGRYRITGEKISKDEILRLLKECESSDILTGSTEIGAHRDDIEIKINGKSAKMFGSQGQQRSAALSLKLSEAEILKSVNEENPVILLDDVMSELDVNRQSYILNHIKDRQVFITCCEPSTVLRMCQGKTFSVCGGKIK
ncbi:MAG: DNA replication and repair protein RecF, partial [Clostridiales bacterium]|nr:DNA replication and repair protein RecF [Clostridiales bacterium]